MHTEGAWPVSAYPPEEEEDADEDTDDGNDGVNTLLPWTVRLPSLRRLSVWHCQRIGGDEVVQALRARVAFTDAVASAGKGATLESVTVVGCSEFGFQHAQALRDALGERLRTDG